MSDPYLLIEQFGWYSVTVLVGLAVHGFLILPSIYVIFTRKNPIVLLFQMTEALFVALATSSRYLTLAFISYIQIWMAICSNMISCLPNRVADILYWSIMIAIVCRPTKSSTFPGQTGHWRPVVIVGLGYGLTFSSILIFFGK